MQSNIIRDVTLIIKTFKRKPLLDILINSINKYYNGINIIILNDDIKEIQYPQYKNIRVINTEFNIGVAKGRNILVSNVTTPYFLMLDDDYEFYKNTDISIMYNILENNSMLDIIAGVVDRLHYQTMKITDNEVTFKWGYYRYDKKYDVYYTDVVSQFFMGRMETFKLRDIKWPENLKVADHSPFMYILKKIGGIGIGVTPSVQILHNKAKNTNNEYKKHRSIGAKEITFSLFFKNEGIYKLHTNWEISNKATYIFNENHTHYILEKDGKFIASRIYRYNNKLDISNSNIKSPKVIPYNTYISNNLNVLQSVKPCNDNKICVYANDNFIDDITFIIKTGLRPNAIIRLLNTLLYYYPKSNILIAYDDDTTFEIDIPNVTIYKLPLCSGVSYARNFLVDKVNTKYFINLDDDFIISEDTDIEYMYYIMENSDIDLLAGQWRNKGRYKTIREINPGYIEFNNGHNGFNALYNYYLCDATGQFLIGRTDKWKSLNIKWNDELKTGEHTIFYYNIWKYNRNNFKVAYTPNVIIDHDHSCNTPEYNKIRLRSNSMLYDYMNKNGIYYLKTIAGSIYHNKK